VSKLLTSKPLQNMTEEKKAYEESIIGPGVVQVGFKLPQTLYEALQLSMKNAGYQDGLGNYYFYLVGYEFYQTYQEIFHRVNNQIAPVPNSMIMADLPKFGVDTDEAWEIFEENTDANPVMIYKLSELHLKVCQHLAHCLNYHRSDSILYRFFTIRILISKLRAEIAQVRRAELQAQTDSS